MIVGIAGIGSGGGHANHHVLPPPPRLLLVMPNNDSDVHHHLHRIRIRRMRRRARGLCCIINRPLGTGTGTGTGRFVESAMGADDFSEERSSPDEVQKELKRCYQLVHKLGRGVVYLGSSRLTEADHHPHYLQALELAREGKELSDADV